MHGTGYESALAKSGSKLKQREHLQSFSMSTALLLCAALMPGL